MQKTLELAVLHILQQIESGESPNAIDLAEWTVAVDNNIFN